MHAGCFAILLAVFFGARAHDSFWYPALSDGAGVVATDADTFSQALASGRTIVVHFSLPKTDDPQAKKIDAVNEQMLRLTAQTVERRNISVYSLNMINFQTLAEQQGITTPDSIVIYRQGQKFFYKGHRSAEPLISFINKLDQPLVSIIDTKPKKKAFEYVQTSKVIGYFQAWPTNQEMTAFEAAARAHYPSVPFFAVVTNEMALEMKFTTLGEIHISHPFEKTPKILPQNPATEADITAFLESEGQPIMRRVLLEDLHNVWVGDGGDDARLVAFMRQTSPQSNVLFKALKNMAKYGLLRNLTQKTILIIDPDDFPMLVDYWQITFNVDLTLPALGLINITDNNASWADLSLLEQSNSTDQLAYLSLWLEAVSAGRVRVDGQDPIPTQLELEAAAKEALEMAERAAEAAQHAASAAQAAAQAAAAASRGSSGQGSSESAGGEIEGQDTLADAPQKQEL